MNDAARAAGPSLAELFARAQHPYRLNPGATELIFLRHGAGDSRGSSAMLDGQGDAPLTPEGEGQAELAAARLARRRIDTIFVSTMQRTRQTAAPVAAATGLTPVVLSELREYGIGMLEGPTGQSGASDAQVALAEATRAGRLDVVPGAEPLEHFRARIAKALGRVVVETGPDRTALVVSHGLLLAELCAQATGGRMMAFIGAENCSLSFFEVVRADVRLRGFNDTAHLPTPEPS